MHVIHFISSISDLNRGVWSAALSHSNYLSTKGVRSILALRADRKPEEINSTVVLFKNRRDLETKMRVSGLNTRNTIIVSHGVWSWPSRLGFYFKEKGFAWVAVPHGMLEPWSRNQKKLKKLIYYQLLEQKYLNSARALRAVSKTEYVNLKGLFGENVFYLPNGVDTSESADAKIISSKITFLFMSRLHHKKGLKELLRGWISSNLGGNSDFELIIAGPDDGELEHIRPFIESTSNIVYVGPIYGKEKAKILQRSHIFVLPSYSEGLPSSVLEAMDYGLLALISQGCNFTEVIDNGIAKQFEPSEAFIVQVLNSLEKQKLSEIVYKGELGKKYVRKYFHNDKLSETLYAKYMSLLDR